MSQHKFFLNDKIKKEESNQAEFPLGMNHTGHDVCKETFWPWAVSHKWDLNPARLLYLGLPQAWEASTVRKG